jgi:hypothetical protein
MSKHDSHFVAKLAKLHASNLGLAKWKHLKSALPTSKNCKDKSVASDHHMSVIMSLASQGHENM